MQFTDLEASASSAAASTRGRGRRQRLTISLVALAFCGLSATGCKRIVTYAVDRALGDDAGLDLSASGESTGGGSAGGDMCKLVTDAEVQTATGKKVINHQGSDSSCGWALGGALGSADEATPSGNVQMNIIGELSAKVIPAVGEQKAVTGVGNKAEWSGGMAPTLRVHIKGGNVMMFMIVDPSAMMKNSGFTEKAMPGAITEKGPDGKEHVVSGTSAVNMEYPEVEKEAIAIAKIAVSRY